MTSDFEALHYAAFTIGGVGGNPAGIVYDDERWTATDRVGIADLLGYSETAFIGRTEADGDALPIRFYSPRGEIAMCGHATLAAAVALADQSGPGEYRFATAVGTVSVDVTATPSGHWQGELRGIPAGSAPASDEEVDATLRALRWTQADLDRRYPPYVLLSGNCHLLLAATREELLSELDYDINELRALMDRAGWATVHLVHARSDSLFAVRAPFPTGGLYEDAATGSAAVAFGAYLLTVGAVTAPARITSHQGQYMQRPCELVTTIGLHRSEIVVTGTGRRLPTGP